jgi:TPR repeat protein
LCKLGDYYHSGIVVEKDDEKAEHYYRMAAMKGDREAVRKLYDMLYKKAETKADKKNWSDIILSEMDGEEPTNTEDYDDVPF